MIAICLILSYGYAFSDENPEKNSPPKHPTFLPETTITDLLGWVSSNDNRCGGFYVEPAISSRKDAANPDMIAITSNQFLFSLHGVSDSQGKITIHRYGQEIIANRAFLYRNPQTGEINAVDLIGNVILREPNSLVFGQQGYLNRQTKMTSLFDILYRTRVYSAPEQWKSIQQPLPFEIEHQHVVTQLSAWGQAAAFEQKEPKIFTFDGASYSTCPPTQNAWKVKASHIELNKNTGRGEAYNTRILLHNVPVFYLPYLNFPIDARRKTGFLQPKIGVNSQSGPYIATPFYWNMAPNYDMTITPDLISKRGIQFADLFRYLTPDSNGTLNAAILPNDQAFSEFQTSASTNSDYTSPTASATTQSELQRLLKASTTRKSLIWNDSTRFNDHWFGDVQYNYVSDDYYLGNFSTNINEITQNQLLQQASLQYKGQYWNFTARSQSYQTLHPIDSPPVSNSYSRYPQLVLNGIYPNAKTNLEYFINNELTYFTIMNTPGDSTKLPQGYRIHTQPGISWPLMRPYSYFTPRVQFSATQYKMGDIMNTQSSTMSRVIPIFDIASGLYFDRRISFFKQSFLQTLEPQAYYTYIPFVNQNQIPVFDTTLNMLNYDQLFTYNRFSGIDRIGDANQLALGLTTRFIDQQTGLEKIHASLGQIYYFKNRQVTLCNPTQPALCMPSALDLENLQQNKSPLSGVLSYNVNKSWNLQANAIWNPLSNQLDNETATLHYEPETNHIINFSYTFVRNGDLFPGEKINTASNNLSQTDLSAAWPIFQNWSGIGRWTQNLNRHNFQNLISGVQYDTCCWAIRLVAGREFLRYNANNTSQYNTEFYFQFALKGLGNFGSGDPTALVASSVSGYHNQFGQDF